MTLTARTRPPPPRSRAPRTAAPGPTIAPASRRPATRETGERRRGPTTAATPPEATTGSCVRPSTCPRPARSGPAPVPSRSMSVTTTPPSAQALETHAGPTSSSRPPYATQPRTATSRRTRAVGARATGAVVQADDDLSGPALDHARRARRAGSTAAVPTTTRATPPRAAPPPTPIVADATAGLHRHPDRRRRCAARSSRFGRAAVPGGVEVDDVQARRPRRHERLGLLERVAVDGLGRELAPAAGARTCRRGCRWRARAPRSALPRPARRTEPCEAREQAQAGGWPTSPGGTGCRTGSPARRRRPAPRRSRRSRRRSPGRRALGNRGVGVDEVVPLARAVAEQARASPRALVRTRFHCICGRRSLAAIARTVPSKMPEAGDVRVLLRALEEKLQPDADAEERPARRRSRAGRPRRARSRRSALAQAPKAPTPGSTTPDAPEAAPSGSSTRRASAPTCCRAFSAERRLPMP